MKKINMWSCVTFNQQFSGDFRFDLNFDLQDQLKVNSIF